MQALAAVFGALLATLLLQRSRVPLGLSFLVGAVLLGPLNGGGFGETQTALWSVASDAGTWLFVVVVGMVFALSNLLSLSGGLDVLVQGAGHFIKNRRLRLASLPALVGLLPMPGGAVVSAPLVDKTHSDVFLGSPDKNLINYWFRHIWEVCWPLYPPLLLAAALIDTSVGVVCALQVPLMLFLAAFGYIFILRRVPGGSSSDSTQSPGGKALAKALLPLGVVVVFMPLTQVLSSDVIAKQFRGQVGLIVALSFGLCAGLLVASDRSLLKQAVCERRLWMLVLVAFGVKMFGGMVEASGAALGCAELFRSGGVSPLFAIILLPLLVGFATGNAVAFVTVVFPVLLAIKGGPGTPPQVLLPWCVLAYAMGFVGYMLSPVHMCLLLSSKYFGEAIGGVYPRIAPPLGLFAGASMLFFWLLQMAL